MEAAGDRYDSRPQRVVVPVLVTFDSESYTVRDFTLNLSEGGIFLQTERLCSPGTRGALKFRATQFESPFTLRGEVVRVVRPGEGADGQQCGLGIRFLEVSEGDLKRLRRLVEGVRDGSVVQAIRRSIRESSRTILEEIRRRPVDQKMMLAVVAQGEEITALIRDGNPSVLIRLFGNPRLAVTHVQVLLQDKGLPTRVLSAVKKCRKWMQDDEVQWLFCSHPNTILVDVMTQLPSLPAGRLRQLATDRTIRPKIRIRAQELVNRTGRR